MKVARKNNKFKYYAFSILGVIVLLITLIVILGNRLPNVLYEDNIVNYATEINSKNTGNGYIVYIYSPGCSYCQKLAQTPEFQAFEANPAVRYYKVNIDGQKDFTEKVGLSGTPTLYYIERVNDSYKFVKVVGFTNESLALLSQYTK